MTCLHNHDQILEFLRKIFLKGFQIYQNYLCALRISKFCIHLSYAVMKNIILDLKPLFTLLVRFYMAHISTYKDAQGTCIYYNPGFSPGNLAPGSRERQLWIKCLV